MKALTGDARYLEKSASLNELVEKINQSLTGIQYYCLIDKSTFSRIWQISSCNSDVLRETIGSCCFHREASCGKGSSFNGILLLVLPCFSMADHLDRVISKPACFNDYLDIGVQVSLLAAYSVSYSNRSCIEFAK